MELLINTLRVLHVVAGSLALLTGPIAMFNQNGGKLHRTCGNIFFWAMMFIVISSVVLSINASNWFLLMIGIFTFNIISTGKRALKLKKLHVGQRPERIDWIIFGIAFLSGISLTGWGLWTLFGLKNSFGIVGLAFGGIILRGVRSDYKRFTVPPTNKNHWLFVHIGNMMGGYIAAITAFLVQNVRTDPAFIAWLAPTVIIVPFLSYTIRKFQNRTKKNQDLKLEYKE